MSITPTHQGEVQFVTYADSSKGGPRITLRLHDRDELQAFIGKEGKRFMVVLVEIGEDEQPVPPVTPPRPAAKRVRMDPLCEWAVLRCGEALFQSWIEERFGPRPPMLSATAYAERMIKESCGVESRKEFDANPAAAEALHAVIRRPYAEWLRRQGVTA